MAPTTIRARGRALVAAATLAVLVAACTPVTPPAGDGLAGAPTVAPTTLPSGALAYTGVRYGTASGVQFLDLYRPAGTGPFPLVVWFHGGYWTQGSRNQLPPGFRDDLLSAGYAVATVDYRLAELLANQWPVGLRDAKLAVKYLQTFAGALGVDAGRVVTAGHSAGGHLALMVAVARNAPGQSLTTGDPSVDGALTFGAPVDIPLATSTNPLADLAVRLLLGCGTGTYCDSTTIQPWRYLDAADPALLMVSGGADVVVPEAHAQRMATAASDVGHTELELATVPGVGHDELNVVAPAATYVGWLDVVAGP